MHYIGIDPGKAGGIAVLWEGGREEAWDMPEDERGMVQLFQTIMAGKQPRAFKCALEKAQAMPGQGVTSMFNYGVSFGILRGVLASFSISTQFVTPRKWQKVFDNRKKGEDTKKTSLKMARRLFPRVELHLKKDHGKSDALLIALWLKGESDG